MRLKKLAAVILSVLILSGIYIPVYASTSSNINIKLNNTYISFDAPVVNYDGTILVPAKEFIKSLGGTFSYNADTMTGEAQVGSNQLSFSLDDSVACFNGKNVQAPAPMKIMNDRFMIPAGFAAGELGAAYYYDASRNTLLVYKPSDGRLVYDVMPGDNLWLISQLFYTSVASIEKLNSLSGTMINVGQELYIRNLSSQKIVLPAYTTAGATIMSGAGFGYNVVGYLKAWTNISVTGKEGDWYMVTTPAGNGYIYKTVIGMDQQLTFGASQSSYFDSNIPVDTSEDTVSDIDYTVVSGDSLWSVSLKYGIPEAELANANGVSSTATLYPGQKIKVPVHNIAVKATPGPQYGEMLDWFSEGQYVFPIGTTGKLVDVATGKSFMVKRTMGANHSDTETLTAQDTATMKEIFGGTWSWVKRPFILETGGRKIAVSVAGMPHDGVDGVPFLQNVADRSDNYGYGPNYDSIAGNGMNGHFDMYFLNSIGHANPVLDPVHQYDILVASGLQ